MFRWFSSDADVLVTAVRRRAQQRTELACAQAWTIRVRLIKPGAVVKQSVRRVTLSMNTSFSMACVFTTAMQGLWKTVRRPARV